MIRESIDAIPTSSTASLEPRLGSAVPLREILERFEAPRVIDFLSLSGRTEDNQHAIFNNFPFDRYRFSVVTAERPSAELKEMLKIHGYIQLIEFAHSETLWIHQSIQHTVDQEGIAKQAESLTKNGVASDVTRF